MNYSDESDAVLLHIIRDLANCLKVRADKAGADDSDKQALERIWLEAYALSKKRGETNDEIVRAICLIRD